jgi:hypothetical protein
MRSVGDTRTGTGVGPSFDDWQVLKGTYARPHLHPILDATGTNAPVAIDDDYVIVGAANALSSGQQPLIITYKLGAKGKLPDTVR